MQVIASAVTVAAWAARGRRLAPAAAAIVPSATRRSVLQSQVMKIPHPFQVGPKLPKSRSKEKGAEAARAAPAPEIRALSPLSASATLGGRKRDNQEMVLGQIGFKPFSKLPDSPESGLFRGQA